MAFIVPVVIPVLACTVAVVIFVERTFGRVDVVEAKLAALIKPVTSNAAELIPVDAFNVPVEIFVTNIFGIVLVRPLNIIFDVPVTVKIGVFILSVATKRPVV